MKALTKHQIINDSRGNPLFAVVPYNEYKDFLRYHKRGEATIPNSVVEFMVMKECSIIKAWRHHKRLSQRDVAERMEISQAAFSQMEQPQANLRKETLQKIADALGIGFEQIEDM